MSSLLTTASVTLSLLFAATPPPEPVRAVERSVVGEQFTFVVRASPVSNLTYQLDCIAGIFPCSRETYVALWKDSLRWSADDEKQLEAWKRLREKYFEQVPFGQPSRNTTHRLPPQFDGIDLEHKFRMAGHAAKTLDEYRANLELVLAVPDVDQVLRVLAHFQPRFEGWWTTSAAPKLVPFLDATVKLLEQERLTQFIEKVAHFYEARLPKGTRVHLNLVFRPPGGGRNTSGEQIQNHSVVEVLEGEAPESRIDVVLHELFHFFYATAAPERRAAVMEALFSSAGADGLGAWALLNESLAAALGNGLVARRVLPPEKFERMLSRAMSLYNDPLIDPSARALMPVLERALERGDVLSSPGFRAEYLQAVRGALGAGVSGRLARLKLVALVYDEDLRGVALELTRRANTGGAWSNSPIAEASSRSRLERHPDLTGAVFVSTRRLQDLEGWKGLLGAATVSEIRREARTGKPFVYGVRRTNGEGFIYLFVGRDAEAISPLLPGFLKDETPCLGVCTRLEGR
ncbi:MAG: hypothetical protein WBV82_09315 [Myxococcaceae bacterium]